MGNRGVGGWFAFALVVALSACAPESPATPVERMEELVVELDEHWRELDEQCDSNALFALVYKLMTEGMLEALERDRFDDPELMARMSERFAERYHAAFSAWDAGDVDATSKPWLVAFEWAASGSSSASEDAALAMIAHIRYDLPLVVAELEAATDRHKADYDRVEEVLAEVMEPVFEQTARYYEPTFALDQQGTLLAQLTLSAVVDWRAEAWADAERLMAAEDETERSAIRRAIADAAVEAGRRWQVEKPNPTEPDRVAYCEANP